MCGVIGTVLSPKHRSADQLLDICDDFTEMLVAAQVRGIDAAGVFVINEGGEHFYYRAPMAASRLVNAEGFYNVLDNVTNQTIAIVGHTRAATTGSPAVNDNNHPIYDAPLLGVHNGVIHNHRQLRAEYGAVADVDSAVILSVIKSELVGDEPLTRKNLVAALPKLQGSFAIAVTDLRDDSLFLARNAGSPMVITQRTNGQLWFASTETILAEGLRLQSKIDSQTLPANTVLRLTRTEAKGVKQLHLAGFTPAKVINPTVSPRFELHPPQSASTLLTGGRYIGGL